MRAYLDDSLKKAQKTGYAVSEFGRRRRLPDLKSSLPMLRAAAERMAVNMPLQGTAADVMKIAMIRVQEWVEKHSKAHMLLQVHDELVLEVPVKDVETVAQEVKKIMESAADLPVPLNVDVEVGSNWRDLEKL